MPELIDNFKDLPLWKHFISVTANNTANRKMVEDHINFALPLLDRFIVAFPKYTLHNRQHHTNIIRLIGNLLDDRLQQLSGLECAVLILSAAYHDIGMVFSDEELLTIKKEPEFNEFLVQNKSARLRFEELNKEPDNALIGWYCRWMHAKRVWIFLNDIDQEIPLKWDDVPIKKALGFVCESHNQSVDYIKGASENFDTDFLGHCDLMFCAILLRLADIMDFDNSRSPLSVYEFLKLDKSEQGADKVSDDEWQKHLSSRGFTVKREGNHVRLKFIACPRHPKIEIAIRDFLKVIEFEISGCVRLLRYCAPRWQTFQLPEDIDVSGIISDNYRSGNYHFSLAEDDVMNLLSGEKIYNETFIFLRELLQNALDTSRHREFRERFNNQAFISEPISVSFFNDPDGYQWIRVDDYGMGMNEEIIENYLLKKGKSYYNSDAFKLEKLDIHEKIHVDFKPISRFGIGLLSCFIAGDRIEISTKHKDETGNAFRLSVEGRSGFFTIQVQKEHHNPTPMPTQYKSESGYRSKPGTSIAVRITTNNEYEGLDLKHQLSQYLMAPPIPVIYNGERLGGDFNDLLTKTWTEDQTYEMSKDFVERSRKLTGLTFESGIKVNVLSVNITEDGLSQNVKGQLVVVYIDLPSDTLLAQGQKSRFTLEMQDKGLYIHCSREFENQGKKTEARETDDISYITDSINIPSDLTKLPFYPYDRYHFGGIRLSHNGIRIPEDYKRFSLNEHRINNYHPYGSSYTNLTYISTGIIYFEDELLPDLTVSRNEIRQISFPVIANVLTATRSINKLIRHFPERSKYDIFKELDRNVIYHRAVIDQSRFYEDNRDFWNNEITVLTAEGNLTVKHLIEKKFVKLEFRKEHYTSYFYQNFVEYVLQSNFDVSIELLNDGRDKSHSFFLNQQTGLHPDFFGGFDPFTFIQFDNCKALTFLQYINVDHPFMQWYSKAYSHLSKNYYYYSTQLIYALFNVNTSRTDMIEMVNRILEKLRRVLPVELRPPVEIAVSANDFEISLIHD